MLGRLTSGYPPHLTEGDNLIMHDDILSRIDSLQSSTRRVLVLYSSQLTVLQSHMNALRADLACELKEIQRDLKSLESAVYRDQRRRSPASLLEDAAEQLDSESNTSEQ